MKEKQITAGETEDGRGGIIEGREDEKMKITKEEKEKRITAGVTEDGRG